MVGIDCCAATSSGHSAELPPRNRKVRRLIRRATSTCVVSSCRLASPGKRSTRTAIRQIVVPWILGPSQAASIRRSPVNVRLWPKCEVPTGAGNVCFSNRPFGVKRFQTIHQHSVDVARGLVLLFGIGARALPSWVSRTGRNNLLDGLAVFTDSRSKQTYELASSVVPRGTSFHRSVELDCPPILFLTRTSIRLLLRLVRGSTGTRCRQPRCGAGSRPADAPARRSPSSSRAAWRSSSPTP